MREAANRWNSGIAPEGVTFEPVWFDSMGAKSACVFLQTPDVSVIIDPGVAAMQPGFPGTDRQKKIWRTKAHARILAALSRAQVVVISHYHHDHYLPEEFYAYRGKTLLVKNPNEFINESQRERAELFFGGLLKEISGSRLEDVLQPPAGKKFADPMEELPLAREKDFGDYNRRRREVLRKGARWFRSMAAKWRKYPLIPQIAEDTPVRFAEGQVLRFGQTVLRFSPPLFHGVDYSRLGWVFATVVEFRGWKLLHTSDLSGPVIEDYAEWITREDPDILILDGPMTYMLGYLVSRTNLQRAVDNALAIVRRTHARLIFYDHHLPREPKFRERTRTVWEEAKRLGRPLFTAAEYLGRRPKVLQVAKKPAVQRKKEGAPGKEEPRSLPPEGEA